MTKILFVCSAGMSSSLVADKMNVILDENGNGSKVEAFSVSELKNKIDKYDYVIAAPQLKFMQKKIVSLAEKSGKPFYMIEVKDYGKQNGAAILQKMGVE